MTTIQRVLFLCTGNYYRSRYAEELFNHIARAEGLGWRAFSCGAAEQAFPENVGPWPAGVASANPHDCEDDRISSSRRNGIRSLT
jgi:protein-tyrosine-phosphatase